MTKRSFLNVLTGLTASLHFLPSLFRAERPLNKPCLIERCEANGWRRVRFSDLSEGDVFRYVADPDGKLIEGFTFRATSAPYAPGYGPNNPHDWAIIGIRLA